MFRLFGFWELGREAGGAAGTPRPDASAYSEALLAGWVPPLAEIRAEADRPTSLPADDEPDSADFLARVYLHQEC